MPRKKVEEEKTEEKVEVKKLPTEYTPHAEEIRDKINELVEKVNG